MITVTIDNRLRVRKSQLPIGHEAAIKARLTVANGDKAAARKRRQWDWESLPDSFPLYAHDGPYLIMPRGYAFELRAGLELSGEKVIWIDQTSAPSLSIDQMVLQGPTLRPEQESACSAILLHRQGVLQAPTAMGKTVVVLEAWRRTGLTGLILVEKAQLASQWRERALEHLGIEAGMIGEGEWNERPLTIAMMQTLRRRELSEHWWRRWGFTQMDEAHHARAATYQEIALQVRSRYFGGVTATPLEDMWEQPFLTHTLGPIFHITTDEQLRRSGRRVTPTIKRVRTGWHWARPDKDKQLVDTKVIYRRILKALEGDLGRVGTIALNIIAQPPGCAQLVLCKSLAYLDHIKTALESGDYEGDVHMLRGAERGAKAQEVAEAAGEGHCVILSTVAGEGTDIPRLDRLHLVWPQRQELALKQAVGRVLRTHPDKRGAVVFDYVDDEGMLANQARLRAIFYRKQGYEVQEERVMQRSFTS
jgi:superfamily II DNA or RNA helicase